ncbi:hypothetical protein EG329_001504 [Mollisiaceae sp. DMI_Dod_QoI]|nr:hypothetical protein EG329_001504 [Helotiales sp. DMI_Dod_QoI]
MAFAKMTLALCLSLLSSTLAAPTSSSLNATSAVLVPRIARNACWYSNDVARTYYHVDMAGWGNNDDTSRSGCGTGYLDNLHGQCGSDIQNWGCTEVRENPHDTHVDFEIAAFERAAGPKCVQDALWLASPPDNRAGGVTCQCTGGTAGC